MRLRKSPAAIEYAGIPGATQDCLDAVQRLIQYGTCIKRAIILSSDGRHGLLLATDFGDMVAVKSGFASGYGGTGPSGLSQALALLLKHGAEIAEHNIDEAFLVRLDESALTMADLEMVERPQTGRPSPISRYIHDRDFDRSHRGTLWDEFPAVIPFAIIDSRLADLAISFWDDPDSKLLKGYRRLEDIVRERTKLKKLHSSKLFSQAFTGDSSKLVWSRLDESEQHGRGQLFAASYMAHRNPRSHREKTSGPHWLSEFLLLNHLYLLEKEASKRRTRNGSRKAKVSTTS